MFNYPPFSRLIRITLRHSEAHKLAATATELGQRLRQRFGSRVLGPVTPLIDRIRGELIVEIILKIEVTTSFARARATLTEQIDALRQEDKNKGVTIICNVDPV